MADTSEADLKALQSEMRQLRSDLAEVVEKLKAVAGSYPADLMAKLKNSGGHLGEGAAKMASGAAREIEERPVTSALTAFTLGLILGALFGGRRD